MTFIEQLTEGMPDYPREETTLVVCMKPTRGFSYHVDGEPPKDVHLDVEGEVAIEDEDVIDIIVHDNRLELKVGKDLAFLLPENPALARKICARLATLMNEALLNLYQLKERA